MTLLKKCKGKKIKKTVRKGGAPKESATCYTIGHKKKGTNGKLYKVVKSGKSRRWVKVRTKSGKTQKALNTYRYALSRVKNDTVAFDLLSGRIDQIALLWMIEAEKLLKEQKYIRAYNLVKHVAVNL